MKFPQVGDIFYGATKNEEYLVKKFIDRGSFGYVFEIEDKNNRKYALKVFFVGDDEPLELLRSECELATQVNHENVVRSYFFHDGTTYQELPPYIIMEYVDGENLEEFISNRYDNFFNFEELKDMFIQLALGMQAINEKLLHRDIKPENILISKDRLKIADFGLAKLKDAHTRSNTFKTASDGRFQAPEAWKFSERNEVPMDIYSMGMVFYALATFDYPYPSAQNVSFNREAYKNAHLFDTPVPPIDKNKTLNLGLAQIIQKMLAKSLSERYSNWDDILQSLRLLKEPNTGTDNLVLYAMEQKIKREQKTLASIKEETEKQELESFVKTMYNNSIFNEMSNRINKFNENSLEVQLLLLQDNYEFTVYIKQEAAPLWQLIVKVRTIHQDIRLNGKIPSLDENLAWKLKAFGTAECMPPYTAMDTDLTIFQKNSFNLLLCSTNDMDLYGSWFTLQVTNASSNLEEARVVPFAFSQAEVCEELKDKSSIKRSYEIEFKPYVFEIFNPLLERTLEQ